MDVIKINGDPHEIEAVYGILKAAGDYMVQAFGLMHWAKPYSRENIQRDCKEKDVYVVRADGKYVATFTLSDRTSYYFEDIPDAHAYSILG